MVGYIEEEEEEGEEGEEQNKEQDGKGGDAEAVPALNPINKFRIAGKAVIMQARKPGAARGISNFDPVRGRIPMLDERYLA